jgi:hypothetical protein
MNKQDRSRSVHPSSLILHPLIWYRRRDSNPHCLVPKTSASSQLGYAGVVNPAGLEPATRGVPTRAARVGCCCRLGNDCSYSN